LQQFAKKIKSALYCHKNCAEYRLHAALQTVKTVRCSSAYYGCESGQVSSADRLCRRAINQRIACNVCSKAFNGASSTPGPARRHAASSIVATSLTPTDRPAMLAAQTAH